MNSVVLSYRFPWPPYTGDRLRASLWIEALSELGEVTLLSPAGRVPRGVAADHIPLRRGIGAILDAVIRTTRDRLPLHAIGAGTHDWRRSLAQARARRPIDLAVILLPRCAAWVAPLIPFPAIVDAIDSSALGMQERARAARGAMRLLWEGEARRAAALEERLSEASAAIVVVNEREAHAFGGSARVIRSGVVIGDERQQERDIDCAFVGRLAYFANREAALRLGRTIWPAVRRELPDATLLLAGADAPRAVLALDGRDGITVVSPVPNVPALLRRVRVAALPVQFGTGESNKMLEAAEAGCAIIASDRMWLNAHPLMPLAAPPATDEQFATAIVTMLREREASRSEGARLREEAKQAPRSEALRRMRELALEVVRA